MDDNEQILAGRGRKASMSDEQSGDEPDRWTKMVTKLSAAKGEVERLKADVEMLHGAVGHSEAEVERLKKEDKEGRLFFFIDDAKREARRQALVDATKSLGSLFPGASSRVHGLIAKLDAEANKPAVEDVAPTILEIDEDGNVSEVLNDD